MQTSKSGKYEHDEWSKINKFIDELTKWFPDGLVFIGGIAVFYHCISSSHKELAETSHDIDFALRLIDFDDLRDLEDVSYNPRLVKHTFSKDDLEFDVYVERRNKLPIDFSDLYAKSELIQGVRVACSEHLLLLKVVSFKDRGGSAKGDKDKRDLVRIMLSMNDFNAQNISSIWYEEITNVLDSVAADTKIFVKMASGNDHAAKQIRDEFKRNFENAKKKMENQTRNNTTENTDNNWMSPQRR